MPHPLQQHHPSRARQAGVKAKQALSTAGKQFASGIKRKDGGGSEVKRTVSPPPNSPPPTLPPSQPLPATSKTTAAKKGRGRIIGDVNEPKEMKNNPKIHSPASNSLGQLERLTGRIDDLEAKVAYCGSKMDTLLMVMEHEISELTDESKLPVDTENTLLLSLAGLKHVRDILLNKICFSGAMLKDEHNVIVHRQHDGPPDHPLELSAHAPTSQTSQELSVTGTSGRGDTPSQGEEEGDKTVEPHPLMSSNSSGEREEWVTVSTTHPLVSSDS